jgi:hypothetical protein
MVSLCDDGRRQNVQHLTAISVALARSRLVAAGKRLNGPLGSDYHELDDVDSRSFWSS